MRFSLLPLTAVLFTSCLVGPNYMGAPDEGLPVTWVNALPPATEEYTLSDWWRSFGDSQLDTLIETAFRNSPDMVQAALNINAALSSLRSTGSGLFPSASVNFGGSNRGNYDSSTSHGSWNGGLSASWTPDIWGGTIRSVEAAYANVGSRAAAAAATRTALASGVATTYFSWISNMESLRIAKEQLEFQERTYAVTEQKAAEGIGMASNLDLAQARATIASTRARIPQLEAGIRSSENALALLLGTTVNQIHLTMPSPATYNRIPKVPVGLPSDLLRRRPDIIRAERELHRACANVGVSVANLFPRLSLTGGTSASAGTDFALFWQNSAWNLGASVSTTLLNRTQLNEAVRQSEISYASAMESYRSTVLSAFKEVEDNLISYAQKTAQLPEYEASRLANKQAAELSLRRYNAGESDFLNVAAAQNQWLSAELNIISTRQDIRMTLARLCTSLGGGWKTR